MCFSRYWHGYCGTAVSTLTNTTVMNGNFDRPIIQEHPSAKASEKLRALAAWYRRYAEQAGSTVIWDYRLSTAEDLERQASALELQAQTLQYTRIAPSQTSAAPPILRAS